MRTQRINPSALPVPLLALKEHLRITDDFDDASIQALAEAAVAEIEAAADIALAPQTIIATTYHEVGVEDLSLPIGPVAEGAALTVQTISNTGTLATLASGFWLEAGQYPVLHVTEAPNARLRITYAAGFIALPSDLSLAIKEQTARAYDVRGDDMTAQGLALAASRVLARYKRVRA